MQRLLDYLEDELAALEAATGTARRHAAPPAKKPAKKKAKTTKRAATPRPRKTGGAKLER